MKKKIVAIGGGENGHRKPDGSYHPYETEKIDKEIIRLTEKESPNFLLIAHAQLNAEFEEKYFETMKNIYGDRFGCECRFLTRNEVVTNFQKAIDDVAWADIIYEGGGDTQGMIELWLQTGFDKVLYDAWCSGKVMCGVSAGANCWFQSCSSDSLKIQLNDNRAPMIVLNCLNFIPVFFTPHCNEKSRHTNRMRHMKSSLRNTDIVGVGISNCAALEIIDDEYKLITSKPADKKFKPYGVKAFWKNGRYHKEYLINDNEYRNLKTLWRKD